MNKILVKKTKDEIDEEIERITNNQDEVYEQDKLDDKWSEIAIEHQMLNDDKVDEVTINRNKLTMDIKPEIYVFDVKNQNKNRED